MLTVGFSQNQGRGTAGSRRDFLQAGWLGLAGLSLANLAQRRAVATGPRHEANRNSVILFWLEGGPSHLETYDPKPNAPAEYRGPFATIETRVPDVRFGELLVEQAKVADKFAIVRSVQHENGDHYAAAQWMLTGYFNSNPPIQQLYPSPGAVVARTRGRHPAGLPQYVALPHAATIDVRPGYFGAAHLGAAYEPFAAGGDPNKPDFRVNNLALHQELTRGRLEDRRALLASFDRIRRAADRSGVMESLDACNREAFELIAGDAARKAFDIQSEDPRVRDRYGRTTQGQNALLARRLVEAEVSFVTVRIGGWDHHSNLEADMKKGTPPTDRAIAALIEDLSERGLLDKVLVVVMGEFGRTPLMNKGGGTVAPGRDHWGNANSVLLAGGGIQGGRIIGATNSKAEIPIERPVSPADLVATMFHVLGIDLDEQFANHSGRPVAINNGGKVIRELFYRRCAW